MSTLDDKDRENLTAYLDGELSDSAARALEAKINLDAAARREVDALKQAWSMLDYLPTSTPTAGFTHRTLERLSVDQLTRPGSGARFWLRTACWTAAILASAALGLAAGEFFFRAPPTVNIVIPKAPPAPPVTVETAAVGPLNDQDWIKSQPQAVRDQYALLGDDAKTGFVIKSRLEENQRRQEWLIAGRFWRELDKRMPLPARLTDFPADVNSFVTEYLRPRLAKEELDLLEKARGQWPLYPMTLVRLADKHPPALPGAKGPKSFAELPTDVKNKFKNKGGAYPPKLVKAEGQWPKFAMAITAFASGKKNYIFPHELWPSGLSCLSAPMQDFVNNKLIKVLDSEEKSLLIRADGKWPEYPLAIQETARKHNLEVPWHTLPGARERWDNYRPAQLD